MKTKKNKVKIIWLSYRITLNKPVIISICPDCSLEILPLIAHLPHKSKALKSKPTTLMYIFIFSSSRRNRADGSYF